MKWAALLASLAAFACGGDSTSPNDAYAELFETTSAQSGYAKVSIAVTTLATASRFCSNTAGHVGFAIELIPADSTKIPHLEGCGATPTPMTRDAAFSFVTDCSPLATCRAVCDAVAVTPDCGSSDFVGHWADDRTLVATITNAKAKVSAQFTLTRRDP